MNILADLKQRTDAAFKNLNPIQHLENLNFPSKSGTEGEVKAAKYVFDELKTYGYQPTEHEFQYSKRKLRQRLIMPAVIYTWLLLSVIHTQLEDTNLLLSAITFVPSLILVLAVFNLGRVTRFFLKRRIRDLKKIQSGIDAGTIDKSDVITSRNVIAEIGDDNADQQILFTAHFDSISSKIPMRVISIAAASFFLGFGVLTVLNLIAIVSDGSFLRDNVVLVAILVLILVGLQLIIFSYSTLRNNESHGVIDDGTGVAILLELAKFFQDNPPPDTKIIFGFYGSEETGLVGSTYDYMNRDIDNTKLRVITVDMIGEQRPLTYIKGLPMVRIADMEPIFNEEIAEIADALDIEIKGGRFPYPGSDFASFMLLGGCKANWFISESKHIHSKNDTLENVDKELVVDVLRVLLGYFIQKQSSTPASP